MNTAVAEVPVAQKTIKDHLLSDGMQSQLRMVLPKHVTPERMVRVAMTALTRTPKLAQCTQASFFKCLLDCSQWGLEPDGRRAHLIPFDVKKKQGSEWVVDHTDCTLIIDYKGFAELAYRSNMVSTIHAKEIRTGDWFEYDCGLVTKHIPHFLRRDPGKPKEPGDVFAYFCIVTMTTGSKMCEVMSLDEVNAIRDKSQGYSAFKKGWAKTSPWNDYPIEMGKKTVFKRVAKWLPLSAEFRTAVDHDDTDYDEEREVRRTSVSDISGLIAGGDEEPIEAGEARQEPTPPWNQSEIEAQFTACQSESDVTALANKTHDLYPDQGSAIGGIEDAAKEVLRAKAAKGKKKGDGTLPLQG